MRDHYINLTQGARWRETLIAQGVRFGVVRIESTRLEAKDWNGVLLRLGAGFLLSCAVNEVAVYDCSAKKQISRAIYQGLPWIGYACCRAWDLDPTPYCRVREHNVAGYWWRCWSGLPRGTRQWMRYFREFHESVERYPSLVGVCKQAKDIADVSGEVGHRIT